MTSFIKWFGNARLFWAKGVGQFLLVLPTDSTAESISLSEAWSNPVLKANLVYSAADLGITRDTADAFVSAVSERVRSSDVPRAFIWLNDPSSWQAPPLTSDNAPMLGLDADGTTAQLGLLAPILPGVQLRVPAQSTLSFTGTSVTIGGTVEFSGPRAPQASPPAASAVLSLDSETRGTLSFQLFLQRQSLNDSSSWGFQYLFPAGANSPWAAVYEWLPLAAARPPDALGFSVTMDPSDPVNATTSGRSPPLRSFLAFTGQNSDGSDTTLASGYRTSSGHPVTLRPVSAAEEANPAALVFNGGAAISETDQELQLAPSGDFVLEVAGMPASADLLCGLHGTEMVTFQPRSDGYPGDRLRFTPYQPAYVNRYPFREASPVGVPVDVMAPLLDATYTTSWATVVRDPSAAGAIPYVAQPKGSSLYGHDDLIWPEGAQLMGWKDPAQTLPPGVPFPLAPYAGVSSQGPGRFSPAETVGFEQQVLGPTRRRLIGSDTPKANARLAALGGGPTAAEDVIFTTTTPSGLLATVADGRWTTILLGQIVDPLQKMAFCNPTLELQQAFQTGQLLLVVANKEKLGDFGSGDCSGTAPQFANTIEIGGWKLAANVGTNNRYDDYRNVVIVKGRPGKLYDPLAPGKSLVSNPDQWTQKEIFAAPSDLISNPSPPPPNLLEPPDASELVILSQWLQEYFGAAASSPDDDLAKFNAIAHDKYWTGILFLRMDIVGVPSDLAGILAGIDDPSQFNAHHLGIEISPVTNSPPSATPSLEPPGPRVEGSSSVFGLIDYVDPEFTPPSGNDDPQPVPPTPGTDLDFRLLSLKVLFANTAVRRFQSLAQLTTTSWFGMPVARMGAGGNPYAAMVLKGSLQTNNGQPVYSLSNAADTTFYFANDVVLKIEVTGAVMSTRSVGGPPGTKVVSWFGLSGFLDFKVVRGSVVSEGVTRAFSFDVFSFGSDPDTSGEQLRRGLAFSNLGIQMSFPNNDPTSREIVLVPDEIRFDLRTSTPRPGSLFQQFALELQGLLKGDAATPPSKSGYATVIPAARLTGVDGGDWWGINYQLNLGTPGDLAGRVGLVSQLLTAWAPAPEGPADSYKAMVGLQLPGTGGGAKLISLQTVLKLSIGQIWLQYDLDKERFLLLLTEIALKVLGLLSIPPGSTLFYLYGNPQAAGEPSGLGWYAMYRKTKPPTLISGAVEPS